MRRTGASSFSGTLVGLPIAGYQMLMFYRLDIFKAHALEVPQTWDDVISIAQQMNGTVSAPIISWHIASVVRAAVAHWQDFNGDGVGDFAVSSLCTTC